MAAKRTELDSAELLKQLRSAIQKQAEEVPEGWKTANQWSDEWGISPNAASQVLGRAIKIGLMQSKKFRIDTKTRGNYPTLHYYPTDAISLKNKP
jgi:Fic family protein